MTICQVILDYDEAVEIIGLIANIITIIGILGLYLAYKAKSDQTLHISGTGVSGIVKDGWAAFEYDIRITGDRPAIDLQALPVGDDVRIETFELVSESGADEDFFALRPIVEHVHISGKARSGTGQPPLLLLLYNLAGEPPGRRRAHLEIVSRHPDYADSAYIETRASRFLAPYRNQHTRRFRLIHMRSHLSAAYHLDIRKKRGRSLVIGAERKNRK